MSEDLLERITNGNGYTCDIFDKGDNLYGFMLAFLHVSPLLKRVCSKERICPSESKFIPVREDPFSEGDRNNLDIITSPEFLRGD